MSTLSIPAQDHGKLRLFAVNRPVADMRSALQKRPVADIARDLLHAPHLDTASAELFPVADLADLGLSGYLADGHGIAPDDIAPARARIDALDGYVLLVFSDSFAGAPATLNPGADATHIATYDLPGTDWQARIPLQSHSARPFSGAPGQGSNVSALRRGSALVILVLIALVGAGFALWSLAQ